MATIRKLYSLGEVKRIIAEKEKVPEERVRIYDNCDLCLEQYAIDDIKLTDNHYLFQVDHE